MPGERAIAAAADEQAWNRDRLAQRVDRPHFRVWTYRSPAIVRGCAQHSLRPLAEARMAAGVDLLERATGGGAVLARWTATAACCM